MSVRIYVEGKSLIDISKESGIGINVIRGRYAKGVRTIDGLVNYQKPKVAMDKKKMRIEGAGERVLDFIMKNNYSLSDVAEKCGVSRSTLYAFLYGSTDLSSARLARPCACVNLSTDYVLGLKSK